MNSAQATYHGLTSGRIRSRSFLSLLATQFLGAMNDNMFRWLAVPIAQKVIGPGQALSLGLFCFTLPYLLLTTPAGYFADKFSKRSVIIGCKIAEIVIMVLGIGSILLGNVYLMFAVVALMGAQSALFGPAKFGSIPEQLDEEHLTSGNGLMGLITVMASAVGTIGGYWLYSICEPDLQAGVSMTQIMPAAAALLGVAVAGWLISLMIARLPAADPEREIPANPVTDTWESLQLLRSDVGLLRAAMGIAFFWMLASLAQMNIDPFGDVVLGLEKKDVGPLLAILVAGLGFGSVLAGFFSGGKVELGIVPLGATGIAITSMLLYWAGSSVDLAVPASSQQAYFWSCIFLFLLGVSSGLFDIPLETYLQHKSKVQTRGRILAANNFLAFTLILGAAGLFYLMHSVWNMTASEVFLVVGLGTVPVAVYVFCLLPTATIRFVVWLASHTVYRVRAYGRENIPDEGGALLVPNHVTWIDGILMIITSSRPIRMVAYSEYINSGPIGWLARLYGTIPINPDAGPKALIKSLQTAKEAIENGELICIFAEGELTRTGQMQAFQKGIMRVVKGTGAPVIPVYLDELWGSIFSFRGGRFFWKMPRHWPYPISIFFGTPIHDPKDAYEVRHAVQNLGVHAVQQRKGRQMLPPRLFLRKCKSKLFRSKVADSSGLDLTGGKLLTGTLMMRKLLCKHVFADDEKMVGIFLPPSVGAVVTNAAVTLSGRVPVNLNYTLSEDGVDSCIKQCNLKHVLTSKRFLEKRPFQLNTNVVYLEDIKEKATGLNKICALLMAFLLPSCLLERVLGLLKIQPDDLMTIIFTSGSTGNPKGVMLSYHNVQSNTDAVDQLFHIKPTDVLIGVLPFFHSFGFTGGLWLTFTLDLKTVYHFNPLDGKTIGKLSDKHGVSIIMATPTFMKTYLKRCTPEQMHRLDLAIVGAEKLPADLATAFEEKFGVVLTEGFGATELSPVGAFNVPENRSGVDTQVGLKKGTVGRPMPGSMARIVDPDTFEELGVNQDGLLMFKGPNVMQGY